MMVTPNSGYDRLIIGMVKDVKPTIPMLCMLFGDSVRSDVERLIEQGDLWLDADMKLRLPPSKGEG